MAAPINPQFDLFAQLRALHGYDGNNSINWFRSVAQTLRVSGRNATKMKMVTDGPTLVNSIELGKMYMYCYDPKWKDTLPYYDIFPLVFPFRKTANGFYGINLHYVRPETRLIFLQKMLQYVTDPKLNKRAKLQFTWQTISDFTKFPEAQFCVKQYLWTHVKTRFLEIPPKDWRNAVGLPLQSFQKAQAQTVWSLQRKR